MIVHINGKRWFRKSAGNTYHSVTVDIDGERVYASGRAYGYGEQYQQTAWEYLDREAERLGLPPRKTYQNGSSEPPWQWAERTGNKVVNNVADVGRERDL